MRTATLLVVLALALAACGAGSDAGQAITTTAPSITTSTPVSPSTEGSSTTMPNIDPDLSTIEPALTDLASRLAVDPDEIEVLTAEAVTWPDGSIGCPEEGMSYTQSLVEGSRVVLQHGDRVYVYHAGADEQPFLCPSEDKDGGHEFVPPPGFHS